MLLLVYFILLLLSFYLLAKVCDDYFVESLDEIAQKLKLSSDAAGATLMAIGSSAPELFVAIIAVIRPGDHEQIGMGTIVGSALFNLVVIAGVVGIIRPFTVNWHIVLRDLLFYFVGVLFLYSVFIDGNISLYEAILFPLLYIVYVYIVVKWRKLVPFEPEIKKVPEIAQDAKIGRNNITRLLFVLVKPLDFIIDKVFIYKKNVFFVFFGSIILIGLFSWVLVESAIEISQILDIPEAILALTVLAIGTSVPDMLSSIIVAKQSRGGMAVTNAIASNIFDILIGMGVPFIILIFMYGKTVPISTSELIVSTGLLIISIVGMLVLMVLNKWNIGRKMGTSLILFYIAFLVYEFISIG
ncbi:MAG: calcium/sodium antiporter [Bacteroidota bacterium]